MKGFETKNLRHIGYTQCLGKKECPAMKGFETFVCDDSSELSEFVRRNAPL